MDNSRIILGIDPGSNIMGYGLIKVEEKKTSIMIMGTITQGKGSDHYDKLKHIFEQVLEIIDQYHPESPERLVSIYSTLAGLDQSDLVYARRRTATDSVG